MRGTWGADGRRATMADLRVSSQASKQRRVVGRLGLLKQGLLGLGRHRSQLKVDELGLEQCKLR